MVNCTPQILIVYIVQVKNILVCRLTCSHIKLFHFSVLLCIQVLRFSPLWISTITFLISLHIIMCTRKIVPFLIHIPGSGFSSLCTPRYHVSHLVSHQAVPFLYTHQGVTFVTSLHIKVSCFSFLAPMFRLFYIARFHICGLLAH